MEFSLGAAVGTMLFWVAQAILSVKKGIFLRGWVRGQYMPFLWNWAISIGIPIFAVINGLIVPYF